MRCTRHREALSKALRWNLEAEDEGFPLPVFKRGYMSNIPYSGSLQAQGVNEAWGRDRSGQCCDAPFWRCGQQAPTAGVKASRSPPGRHVRQSTQYYLTTHQRHSRVRRPRHGLPRHGGNPAMAHTVTRATTTAAPAPALAKVTTTRESDKREARWKLHS